MKPNPFKMSIAVLRVISATCLAVSHQWSSFWWFIVATVLLRIQQCIE